MFSKFIKGTVVTTLAIGLFTFQVNSVDAATKVMWGKTELKVGQIGKVTILEDVNLVSLNSDGTITGLRTLKKGEEYRVYQYKGQNGGYYGVGAGSFVPKNDRVKYETPSKSKLEQLKNLNNEPEIIDVTNVSKVEKIFKDVLGDTYEVKSQNGYIDVYFKGEFSASYSDNGKKHLIYDNYLKVSDVYKTIKQLGFPLTESELNKIISESKSGRITIKNGDVQVYSTNADTDIRWK